MPPSKLTQPPSAGAQPGELFVSTAGSGPAIVLLHGMASSSRYWSPGVPALGRSHRLLMPDLLGFGRSPKPEAASYSPAEHVAWLRRTLASLLDAPFVLAGHSMGSLLALHYAVANPESVRALALISTPLLQGPPWGHRSDGRPSRWHGFIAHSVAGRRLADAGLSAVRPLARLLASRVQRDVPPGAARDALRVTNASYWRTLEQVVYASDAPGLTARVSCPILLIHGEHDRTAPLAPVRTLARQQSLRLELIGGAGHNPYVTATRQVVPLLAAL